VIEEIQMLDAVERYLREEMEPGERSRFEQLRKANPELDQLVVEHSIFLNQLSEFGERKNFRSTLHETHNHLLENGGIKEAAPRAKVADMMKKYRRMLAVAASIAGIIAITISGLVAYFTPKQTPQQLEQLNREVFNQKQKLNVLTQQLNNIKIPANANIKTGGTSFLVEGKGYLLTNAHVIKDAKTVIVQNNKGQVFKVDIIMVDKDRDLAILKIDDHDFQPYENLPYGFKKTGAELGEEIFTLGFPRDEIVYGEGYMSAKTGYMGDSMSCQIAIAANPGNSGGPVFNKSGEVIGIVSTRQLEAQGFVFAITAKTILKTLSELKKSDSTYQSLKISNNSTVKGMERPQQIKKIEDCVFLVKTY
jgi:S1-C subfamily serine protease